MTYLLIGPSHLAREKQEELIIENHFQEEERFTYEIEEMSLFTLLEHINTISFLSPKKVVIVKDAFFLSATAPRKVSDEEIEAFLSYLEHQSEDVLLILCVEKIDERKKKRMKTIQEKTTIIELSFQLKERIQTLLQGYQFEKGAMESFLEALKGEELRVDSECEKLKIYKIQDKIIKKEDIENLVAFSLPDQEETVFSFSRNLSSRDKKRAYQDYFYLKKMGVDALSLMGLLESQFRTLYQVKVLKENHYTKEQIQAELKMHPYRVQKLQELLRFFSKSDIQNYLLLLQNLDYQIKSGQIDTQFVVDLLIMRV